MVVCKCKKATKLYCFVHRTPVCFDCVCSSDHQNCVVWQYSDWVNDGDYDWPPLCPACSLTLLDPDKPTIRLGCLHVLHEACLTSHLESFPPHTAPAGFVCVAPHCPLPIWPPRTQKEASSRLYTNLRALIGQTAASESLLSVAISAGSSASDKPPPFPPPAFSSPPLAAAAKSSATAASAADVASTSERSATEDTTGMAVGSAGSGGGPATEPSSGGGKNGGVMPSPGSSGPSFSHPAVAMPRKGSQSRGGEKMAIDITEEGPIEGNSFGARHVDDDDDDGKERKYARRGPLHLQALRYVASFWAPARHALPLYRKEKDESGVGREDDVADGRIRRRGSMRQSRGTDPRRLLLLIAITSCMATMLLLYYRLAQSASSLP